MMSDHCYYDPKVDYKNGNHDEKYLNQDAIYVRNNFIIDNEEITLNKKSSFTMNVLDWKG